MNTSNDDKMSTISDTPLVHCETNSERRSIKSEHDINVNCTADGIKIILNREILMGFMSSGGKLIIKRNL